MANSAQVMLPFDALPTTEGVRRALANVIRDLQKEHEETDALTAARLHVHVNTIQRARNEVCTLDSLTISKIGAVYGKSALLPYSSLWECSDSDGIEPLGPLAAAMVAPTCAKGPKGEMDALPAVKDCIEALNGFVTTTERKRLRVA